MIKASSPCLIHTLATRDAITKKMTLIDYIDKFDDTADKKWPLKME